MNWDAIGAIGEVAGAIAVFATLLYLAIQIRQSTRAATTQTYDSVISGFNDLNTVISGNSELAELFTNGLYDPELLTRYQSVQFTFQFRSYANQWLKLLRLYEQGVLEESEWTRFGTEAAQMFSTPGGKVFCEENGVFQDLYQAVDRFRDAQQITELGLTVANET